MSAENLIALRLALNGVSQVTNGLKSVGTAMAAAFAANITVGNLVRLTEQVIDAADAMGKLAQKTGIAVEALSGLSFAAHMGDLSSEEFANALKFLGKEMASQGDYATSLDDRLMELADQFAAMPDGVGKNALALQNFGKAGLAIIPFLNQGSEAIRKQREEAKEFGVVIDQQFAQNADRFNDNIFRIQQMLKGVFFQAMRDILPVLVEITEQIIRLGKESGVLVAAVKVITVAFDVGAAYVQTYMEGIASLLLLMGSDKWMAFYDAADAIDKARKGQLSQPPPTATQASTAVITEEDGQKAAKILRELIALQLAFHDANLGRRAQEDIRFANQKEEIGKLLIAEDEKNALLEEAEFNHQLKLSEIHQQGEDERLALERTKAAERHRIMMATSDMFGNMAEAAKAFGAKGFAAWKAFATAQALVNTYSSAVGAYNAMVGVPYIGPALAVAAAAAAIGAGMANVAAIQSTRPGGGYMAGGYTGNGPVNQPAGEVHGREFIFSAPATANIGVANLAALHDAARGGSPSVSVGRTNVQLAFINTNSDYRRFLETDPAAEKWVVDMVTKNKFQIGIA